jgi:hypothetical protein
MTVQLVDSSFGREHLASRMTKIVHTDIARDHAPARASVLQVQLVNSSHLKDARATVSILSDHYEWTTLVDLTPDEWLRRANPTTNPEHVEKAMEEIAKEMLARALKVLGA